jgi:CRP/FNR family cyclic AMP-dependent transcriptional regulator
MPKKTLSYHRSLTMTVGMMLAVAAMDDLTIRSAEGRLAAVLLRLCGARLPELGGPAQTVIDVTQSELAQMTNLSRSAVGALLEAYQQRGLVRRSYGRLEITGLDEIVRILEPAFDPS